MVNNLRQAAEQALAQLEINRTNFRKGPSKSICKMLAGGNDEVIANLRAALAEQPAEQQRSDSEHMEPVAWMYRACGETRFAEELSTPGMHRTESVPLYAAPQPRREVELTDEEIQACGRDLFWPLDEDAPRFARAVIEAYKAKQEK